MRSFICFETGLTIIEDDLFNGPDCGVSWIFNPASLTSEALGGLLDFLLNEALLPRKC